MNGNCIVILSSIKEMASLTSLTISMLFDINFNIILNLLLVYNGYYYTTTAYHWCIVHSDLSSLLTHNNNNDNMNLLPLSLIIRSNLEEHFKNVLLSNSFKHRVIPIAASMGSISTLRWSLSYPILWYDKIGIVLAASKNKEMNTNKNLNTV